MTSLDKFKKFLEAVSSYVVVCGSFARGTQTASSDIDFYVGLKEDDNEQSFLPEIKKICKKFGYEMDSVIVGHISVSKEETKVRQVEFSTLFRLPLSEPLFAIKVYGVEFLACRDNKEVSFEDCWGLQIPLLGYEESES